MRSLGIPVLGPNVPRQGNALTAAIGRLMMRLTGWRLEGEIPDVPQCVLIVAPHTSNWDFLYGLDVKLAMRLGVRFLGKHTLFRGLAGAFLRWIGGIPVDRSAAHGVVGESVGAFRRHPKLFLAITPEGTRKKVPGWKSGFYRIAVGAGVPIFLVLFDYRKRSVVLGPLFHPTGDYDADLPRIQAHYSADMAKRPELYGTDLASGPDARTGTASSA